MRFDLILICLLLLGLFASCEEEFIPDDDIYKKEIVIEAIIEKSEKNLPVYAFITYSLPFYSTFSKDIVESSFVRNARVSISEGSNVFPLTEFCINDAPEPLRSEILKVLGYDSDSVNTNICIYADLTRSIIPETNKEYRLEVIVGTDTLVAYTIIPQLVTIDSIWFEKPPGNNDFDSFAQMQCIIADPPNQKDYYRYFTGSQDEPLIASNNSVTDDAFFNGQKFKFTLSKALGPDEPFDETTGLFKIGDTVEIKWCNIPESHYDYLSTLETSRTRQGPFSSYIRIKHNVKNGLGIFGGQHCQHYFTIVRR